MARAWLKRRWFLVAVLVLIQVAPLFFERKLIYFPDRELELTPEELRMAFEEVALSTEDGIRLHGWWLPVQGSQITTLVCHGNAGNISHRLDRALLIQSKLGLNVFLFDYRGYGRSEGSPDEEGTYRDGRAAYRYVRERGLGSRQILLFGESLGAAIAVQLAVEEPSRGLVLESAFTSIPDMAAALYPLLPLGRYVSTRYDNISKITSIRTPLLILHGTQDRTVPFDQGQRLFQAAPEPKTFFPIRGAGHNDTFLTGGEDYWEAWNLFLAGLPSADHP